jgi:group I intron endonuclease
MRRNAEELHQTGIYAIVNKVTGQTYIGLAGTSFGSRWARHRSELAGCKHVNHLLQADWNSFGADAFEFRILEVFPKSLNRYDAREREQAHVNSSTCKLYNLSW